MDKRWELLLEIPAQDTLGEGIIWDESTGAFFWTDILGRRMHRFHFSSASFTTIELHGRLCSFGLTRTPGKFIAAFDKAIGWLDAASGNFVPVVEPELPGGVRFNDGRVGPDGAFWVGTMVEDAAGAGASNSGALYRLGLDLTLSQHLTDIGISNGLCWSPGGVEMYHTDSAPGRVTVYPFDQKRGTLSSGSQFTAGPLPGSPDGALTDSDGRYMTALWEGSAVGVFGRNGDLKDKLELPVSLITCPAFGGEHLNLLAITTARVGLTEAELIREPGAGNLFIYRTPLVGRPEWRFAGPVPG